MIDPWIHVSGRTLAAYQALPEAQPFAEQFWTINEDEHGSSAPDRLHGFALILSNPARTPEIDRDLLIPYFLRYLWQVPFPSYLREAWRSLTALVPDQEVLADVTRSILEHHPSGDLRAEVLAERQDQSPAEYLTGPPMVLLLRSLARDDPAPGVRSNALEILAYAVEVEENGGAGSIDTILHALHDPSAEVRSAAFGQLCLLQFPVRDLAGDGATLSAPLLDTFQRPDNAPVLPHMLKAIMRRGGRGPDQMAAMLNALSAQRESPFFADMMSALDFLFIGAAAVDGPVARGWLTQGRFADGAALLTFLQATFESRDAPAIDRATALAGLENMQQPRDNQAIADFILDQPQTGASLDVVSRAYAFWLRAFKARLRPAASPLALFTALINRGLSLPPDEVKQAVEFRRIACDKALSHALAGSQPPTAAAELVASVFRAIRSDDHDLSSALYPLRAAVTELDVAGLQDIVQSARNIYAARSAAQVLARRFAAFQEEALLSAIESILTNCGDLALADDLVGELPSSATFVGRPSVRSRLMAAIAATSRIPVDESQGYDQWLKSRILRWLE